jgi:DNA excision repair protein ERCC-5
MALAGIGKRRTPKKLSTPLATKSHKAKRRAQPLFDVDVDSDEGLPLPPAADADDPTVQLALQESLESQEQADLQRALEASRNEFQEQEQSMDATSTAESGLDGSEILASEVSDGDGLDVPGRLETALAIANAGPTPKSISMTQRLSSSIQEASVFNAPRILVDDPSPSPGPSEDALEYLDTIDTVAQVVSSIVDPNTTPRTAHTTQGRVPLPMREGEPPQVESVEEQAVDVGDSDEDMELVPISTPENKLSAAITLLEAPKPIEVVPTFGRATKVHFDLPTGAAKRPSSESDSDAQHPAHKYTPASDSEQSEEEHVISDWSRSPSPVADALLAPTENPASKASTSTVEDPWDAAQEMDPHAEEGEFARFLSQVKGKDLDDVRREIDDEIKTLNQQKKAAMRDSEDITQQMIAQIMVRSLLLRPMRSSFDNHN